MIASAPVVPLDGNLVHVVTFLAGAVFSAGIAYATLIRVRRDTDGIGRKVNQSEKIAARRYHNISLAIMQIAPPAKESEISTLLKEECNQ